MNSFQDSFPNLHRHKYVETSPAVRRYNCIAWAVHVDTKWWWPDAVGVYYWPPNVPRNESVVAFTQAFATRGFVPSSSGAFESGKEKIVLYVDRSGKPTHAARQLTDGSWTSKLGESIDIMHVDEHCLTGPVYGQVSCYFERTIATSTS